MHVPLWIWAVTVVAILGFFVFDFYSHVRKPHAPSIKESAWWSAFYVGLALVFGGFVYLVWDHHHGIEYLTGYVTEKALSVDNLFVFALIMGAFQIPRKYQQKVLLIGIALALFLRLIFILLGAGIIEVWSDVFYLFALALLFTAVKMLVDEVRDAPPTHPEDMLVIKVVRKVIPVTPGYESDHLITHTKGRHHFTPLMVALVAIGFVDVLFALDSIPAIYGITQEAYLVFATNAFSLLGLRQLYFLLDGLLKRLVYLSYGLALILAFIGVKLFLHALNHNNLPFVNGGADVAVPEVGTELSLVVIVGVLAITVVASLAKDKRDETHGAVDAAVRTPAGREEETAPGERPGA